MKSKIDLWLIVGMALCYGAGNLTGSDLFVGPAMFLLLVFVIRLLRGTITWIVTGR